MTELIKFIKLSSGQFAIVDENNFEGISLYKWKARKGCGTFYAVRQTSRKFPPRKTVFMHRQLMNATDEQQIDHINGDGTDNRLCNLRACTNRQNACNSKSRDFSSSNYKGVSWCSRTKKWQASLKIDKKRVWCGRHKLEIDAALAYDAAAKKYHGVFARLNFPEET